jgi:hypothetical protein
MTTSTFDQAQHDAWAQDFETPAEREERDLVEAGRVLDTMTDAQLVEDADAEAEEWATAMAEADTLRTEAVTFWYY